MMKQAIAALVAGAALTGAHAEPLNKAAVAEDAKWILHLDLEAFRGTQLGKYFMGEVVEPKVAEVKQQGMNFEIHPRNIQSITAYGPKFGNDKEGALLIKTSADTKKDIDALSGLLALDGNDATEVARSQDEPYALYQVNRDFFVAPNVEGHLVLAKSKEQIDRAREVLTGGRANLAGGKAFAGFPAVENTFFFLGVAEGFNEQAQVPPQAQVLKETDGGRLVVGEQGENLFVNLVFRGKSPESTTKIQQVLQGIVALVSMTQNNPEITALASGTKIATEKDNVTVSLNIPVRQAIDKIKEREDNKE